MTKPIQDQIDTELRRLWQQAITSGYSLGTKDADTKVWISTQRLLDLIRTVGQQVIDTSKDIYLSEYIPSFLDVEEYVRVRDELRSEQRERLNNLIERKS